MSASLRRRSAGDLPRMGRSARMWGVVIALILVGSAEGQGPNIQGLWEIEYKFVEMKGDKNYMNACKGPFPYIYRWNFDICQSTGSNDFTATITGADAGTTRSQTLEEATPDNVIQRCVYRRTTQGPAGETQDWAVRGAPGYPEDTSWQNFRPKDEEGKPTFPRTFRNFQLPREKPYVWGQICFQYDWQDTEANSAGFQFYRNAWRHENETWIFLKNACDCNSASGNNAAACAQCNEAVPGTNLMRMRSNCIEELGVSENDCPLRLVGVSGGTVLYPEELTGVTALPEGGGPGGARMCYMYSEISGRQVRTADQVASTCRSSQTVSAEDIRRMEEMETGDSEGARRAAGSAPGLGGLRAWWVCVAAALSAVVLQRR